VGGQCGVVAGWVCAYGVCWGVHRKKEKIFKMVPKK